MRSAAEIRFRLKQEVANLWLYAFPPHPDIDQPVPLKPLPDPAAILPQLTGTPYASEVDLLARQILNHRLPLLGLPEIDLGPDIHWRRDYVHHRETGTAYLRRVPYLSFSSVGDHKVIWELNRHQHLVLLAQAFRLNPDPAYLAEIESQLRHWVRENPFQRGINWASALEVAFRALSWIWIYHLVGSHFTPEFRRWLLSHLYQHGCHLELNLSVYFSPNTHLLGEAIALHAIGRLFPSMPRAILWEDLGGNLVLAQMEAQVRADGSHFEQSTYYHLYALDFFLFHLLLNPDVPASYRAKLERMAVYLAALVDDAGRLALFGDDDGGRFFHPYGVRQFFAKATLATCAVLFDRPDWLLSPDDLYEQAAWYLGSRAFRSSTHPPKAADSLQTFPDAGVVAMRHNGIHLVMKAGGFGFGSAGHSHADALSLIVSRGSHEILIDPGTYTYISDPEWRDRFRSTAAHNTIRIDGADQANPDGPFRWREHPQVEMFDTFTGICRYRGFTHCRRLAWLDSSTLLITDRVEGPPGDHVIEQFWQCGPGLGPHAILDAPGATRETGWRSVGFATKQEIPILKVVRRGPLPVELTTRVVFP